MKKFLAVLLIATVCFLAGVIVGRFVISRKTVINVVDIKELVEIIERYNEAKWKLERIKEWNKEAVIEPAPKEENK